MNGIIDLKDFALMKLDVVWHESETADRSIGELEIDYDVRRNLEDERHFVLMLQVNFVQLDSKDKFGYEMEAKICGLFLFPEDATEEDMQALIRINGCTVLYGILRGEIANVTGSFPGGKFILPTVYMHEKVLEIERRKSESQEPVKAKRKKAKKQSKN